MLSNEQKKKRREKIFTSVMPAKWMDWCAAVIPDLVSKIARIKRMYSPSVKMSSSLLERALSWFLESPLVNQRLLLSTIDIDRESRLEGRTKEQKKNRKTKKSKGFAFMSDRC